MRHRSITRRQPVPITAEEVGALARVLRSHRGITLRQAAAELDVSVSALSQAERSVASVYRLAIRAANHHLARLAEQGLYSAGHIEEKIQAVGGAIDAVSVHRGPENDRRAALLRQALLARGISTEHEGQFVVIRLPQDALMVDLATMTALAWPGRPNASLEDTTGRVDAGSIVSFDDLFDGLSDEEWAVAIDRFASALVSASAGGKLDVPALRILIDPARLALERSLKPPSSITDVPMGE